MTVATIETRIEGSVRRRFFQEFFGNSAQFPIANILLELLLEGPQSYLRAPDAYAILLAAVAQALLLTARSQRSASALLWYNLAGPAVYTVIEVSIEGGGFFASPNHLAYWAYGAAIGFLQWLRAAMPGIGRGTIQVIEDVVRASILLVMYIIFEHATGGADNAAFFADRSHQFVACATLLLGLSLGLAHVTGAGYLELLRQTAARLRVYSEWLLGRALLEKSLRDPGAFALRRLDRTVLFMDIRGFTAWSEARAPETVVDMLNRYYEAAEDVVHESAVVKFKFSADEMMSVYEHANDAVAAAAALAERVGRLLRQHGLGCGIGLHTGPVVEGLLGSSEVKFYDVMGDTVNTAKRVEGAAGPGEVLVSAATVQALGNDQPWGPPRRVVLKGKERPLDVFPLRAASNGPEHGA